MAPVKEEHRYEKGSTEAYSDLKKAISRMGKIIHDNPSALSVEGKIKYGLGASTKVKAKIQPKGEESIVIFESRGGDFAGRAARDNVKHLVETMTKVDDVDYDVNKADKRQWMRVGYFILGGIGVLIISTMLAVNPSLVTNNWFIITLFAVAYAWGLTKL